VAGEGALNFLRQTAEDYFRFASQAAGIDFSEIVTI
jgi:hypothetical protein